MGKQSEHIDWLIELFERNDVEDIPVNAVHHIIAYQHLLEIVGSRSFFELYVGQESMLLLLHFDHSDYMMEDQGEEDE